MKKIILWGILALLLISSVSSLDANNFNDGWGTDNWQALSGITFTPKIDNIIITNATWTFGADCNQGIWIWSNGGDGGLENAIINFTSCVDDGAGTCQPNVNITLTKGVTYVAGMVCTGASSNHRYTALDFSEAPVVDTDQPALYWNFSMYDDSGMTSAGVTRRDGGVIYLFTVNETGGGGAPASAEDTINITSTDPQDASYKSSNPVNINILYDANNSNNVDLWLNGALNGSNSESAGGGVTSNFSRTLQDGTYVYSFNISDSYQNKTTTNVTFYVDTTAPTENEIYHEYYITQQLPIIVNISDAFGLDSVNITSCNTALNNDSPTNPFYFNQNIDVSNCSYGVTQTTIDYCDTAGNCDSWTYVYTIRNRLGINATSKVDGTAITNFTVYVNGTEYASTTTSNINIDNLTGQIATPTPYNITILPSGFETQSATVQVNATFVKYNFELYTHNSINFTFKDEETKAIVENITLEFISDAFNYNYTTLTGKLYVDLISPQTYTLRYNGFNMSTGYLENFYYFILNNRTHTDLTLYLAKNTTGEEITATVYDEFSNFVEDAYIQTLRYDFDTNSYVLVSQSKTNFLGQAKLYLIKSTEFYKFMIYYPLGTLKEETSPTYIYDDNINFQINLADAIAEDFFNERDITYSLTFNNATDNFRYTYTDANSLLYGACLEIYQINPFGNVEINNTCITGASGTILGGITPLNDTTYLAQAYVQFDADDNTFLDSLEYIVYSNTNPFGNLGLLGVFMLTTVMMFVGVFSISLAIGLVPLPLLLFSALGIVPIPVGLAIAFQLVGLTLAIMLYRTG